jgi:hypothetical protein
MDGKSFLETSYGTYVKLVENSNILDEKIADRLTLVVDKSNKYIDSSSSDESPIPPPSPNNKSTILTYFCNKKQNKKNTIEKTQSIDELVESSLKKNNILALESSHLRRSRVLPHLLPKDPDLIPKELPYLQPKELLYLQPKDPISLQLKMPTHLHQPTAQKHQPTMQDSQPTMQESQSTAQDSQSIMQESQSTAQESQPMMQELHLLPIQLHRSFSHNNLFSDNLSDPFFYNNFMQLPKVVSNNQLSKSLSDSNLQQLPDINIHSSNSGEINNDIIGISEHNLLDF